MYISLPVPVQKFWEHEIFFIPWDLSTPCYSVRSYSFIVYLMLNALQTRIELPYSSSIQTLKQKTAETFSSKPNRVSAHDLRGISGCLSLTLLKQCI